MNKLEVCARIEEIGIIPGIRLTSAEDAQYAAEALNRSGISIAEVTMTVPGAVEVIARLTRSVPEMAVGAGTALDLDTAKRCLDAGAKFFTSTGLVLEVVEFALNHDLAVFPGAFTATEVIAAWKAGADFVKVFPCGPMGGASYIRTLKVPLPQIPLIASGGVNQQTAGDFIRAGASAVGIGSGLIPREALHVRNEAQIHELARRFQAIVKAARGGKGGSAQ